MYFIAMGSSSNCEDVEFTSLITSSPRTSGEAVYVEEQIHWRPSIQIFQEILLKHISMQKAQLKKG